MRLKTSVIITLPVIAMIVLLTRSGYGKTLDKRIHEIREEYARINTGQGLTVDTIEISDESAEGGCMFVYTDPAGELRKLEVMYYGETGRRIEEYYIKNEKLFFAFVQDHVYNRPVYWDEKTAVENADDEWFDPAKSVIIENRYYFDVNETPFYWIDEHKKVITDTILIEQKSTEIKREFQGLTAKIKKIRGEKIMEKHIGCCGMDCHACPIPKIHTGIKIAQQWVGQFRAWKVIKDNEGAEEIMARGPYCINCQADRTKHWSRDCPILKCCVDDHKLNNCSECDSFPCERLLKHYETGEGLKDCQENLRKLKQGSNKNSDE
jgi:hypothetical protein